MRSADGASAPSASQTTPAATATQHSKHDQPRQITHHAPPCLSPPVRRTPTTPSQDFRVLTIVWLGAGWTAPTWANANRTTGLPNSYVVSAGGLLALYPESTYG